MLFPLRVSASVLVSFFAASLVGQTPQTTPSRVLAPIDAASRLSLPNSLHPLATRANDRGALAAGTQLSRLQLLLKRSDAQEADLHQLLDDLHNPASPSFHHWLTPEDFGKRFGPSDADVAKLTGWLASQGFTGAKLLPGRQVLEFNGTADQFRTAFGAEIHQYSSANGLRNASSSVPSIPAALAPVVNSFVTLNNFTPRPPHSLRGKATYDLATGKSIPSWTIGSSSTGYFFPLAPADFAVQYDTAPLIAGGNNGAGQTIAVINISNVNAYFVARYRSLFSLPASPLQVIVDGVDPGIDGVNSPDGSGVGWAGEAYLDVEMTGMAAPGANIDLVIASDTALTDAFSLASEHAVYNNLAPIMSLSVEACEMDLGSENAFFNNLWQQAAAQGITVVVAASDSGSAGCDDFDTQEYATRGQQVNGFASTPYNIAVGGTDFYYSSYATGGNTLAAQVASYWSETASNSTPNETLKSYIPEQPWNNSQYGLNADRYTSGATNIVAGSGGASNCGILTGSVCAPYAKPAWQTGTGVPADGVRDLPDVSVFAANGYNYSYYPICDSDGDCQPVSSGSTVQIDGAGGTSASAPAFAGIMALVTQKYGRQGLANYVLYPLAAQYPAAFHDVTVGTNTVPCNIATTPSGEHAKNCIAVTNPVTVTDQNTGTGSVVEGEIGSGTTAEYKAGVGYDLASGLGSVDANVMIADWNKVAFAATTTTLTPSSTSFAHGTSVTLAGKVTGTAATPTGQVAVMTTSTTANQTSKADFTLASGAFSTALNTLPGGTYTIYGRYSGDTVNASSTSTPITLNVTPESSATALEVFGNNKALSSGATVSYGEGLQMEALPAPSASLSAYVTCKLNNTTCPSFTTPTGSVSFTESGVTLPTVQLDASGEGYFSYQPTVGSHTITAAYSGDASYASSTSTSASVVVGKDTPTYSAAEAVYGNGFDNSGTNKTLSFLVTNSNEYTGANVTAPSGSLTFTGGPSTMPASANLAAGINPNTNGAAGIATVTLPATTPAGTYTIHYAYPGDTNYVGGSGTYSVTLTAATGTVSTITASAVSGSVATPAAGVNITVTVTGNTTIGTPTGYLFLFSNGTFYGYDTLPAGSGASVTDVINVASGLFTGSNVVTVEYVSFNGYQPSETTVAVSKSVADFTLLPTSTTLTTSTSSVTDNLNLASTGSFAGAVNLTCAATGGVTCSFSSTAPTLTAGGLATSTVTLNPNGAAVGAYSAVITGADTTGQYVHTATLTLNVVSSVTAPGLTLSSAGNITLASPGATGSTMITLTPSGSFAGSVALSCAITSSPANAADTPTCVIPSAVTVTAGTAATSTLTINSTAPKSGVRSGTITLLGSFAAGSLLMLTLTPRRRRPALFAALLTAALLTTLTGCGGNKTVTGGGGTGDPGTSTGAYAVTVTATGSGVTATTVVGLTIN